MMSARSAAARISAVILLIAVAAMLPGCGLFDDGQNPEAATLVEPTPSATTPASAEPQPPAAGPSSIEERKPKVEASVKPPPTTTSASVATASLAYDGPSSLEERILASPVIAKVRLDSVSSTTESGPTVQGTKYILLLEFSFSVLEYLKGSGNNDIVAVWNSDQLFGTRQEAEAALPAIAAARDAQWDDHEAIVFLKHSQTYLASTQRAERYYLSGVVLGSFGLDDNYSLASRYNNLWLPAEASADATSQPSGDQQRFLMYTPVATGTARTITLSELKTRTAAVAAKIDASDGSEEYMECVSRTYYYEGINSYRMATEGRGYYYSTPDHELGSGLAASAAVYEQNPVFGGLPDKRGLIWLDGGDADLFSVEYDDAVPYDFSGDGVNDTIRYAYRVVASRPLPAGVYRFHFNNREVHFVPCDGYTIRYEWTVTVNAPVGSLHEFFFDPVTDGVAVAADSTHGVLYPAGFTDANGALASISRIEWESGTVAMFVAPHTGLADHFVDFIEPDGSVSLSLSFSAATVDVATGALRWAVASRPWEDGDLLMARIRVAQTRQNH